MLVRQGRVAELDGADQVLIEDAVARPADTDAVVAALAPGSPRDSEHLSPVTAHSPTRQR